MDYEEMNESSEIFDQSVKIKKLLQELQDKKVHLIELEENLKLSQQNSIKQLAELNSEIEIQSEQLEKIIERVSEKNNKESTNLAAKCEYLLANMLAGIDEIFTFKIEYESLSMEGKIKGSEDYTFYSLKKMLKRQLDRDEDDFYFTDQHGMIYLDNLSVRRALFPFSNVNIRGYIPIVKIIDKKSETDMMVEDYNKTKKEVVHQVSSAVKKLSWKEELIQKTKRNFFVLFYTLTFTLFLLCWINSLFLFRGPKEIQMVVSTFKQVTESKLDIRQSNLLLSLKIIVSQIFQYPTEDELKNKYIYILQNTNLFNQYNRRNNFMRIIQQRAKQIPCVYPRLNNSLNYLNRTCYGGEANENLIKANINYTYFQDPHPNYIKGQKKVYDNSGYYVDVNIQDPTIFYSQMNSLINAGWIDGDTTSVMIVTNIYLLNVDLFIVFRTLFEFDEIRFKPFRSYSIIDMTPLKDNSMIAAAFFSVILLIFNIFNLKTNELAEKYEAKRYRICEKHYLIFCNFFRYLRYHFRMPNAFETLCKLYFILAILNIFFTYTCMIYKLMYCNTVSQMKFSTVEFNDIIAYNSFFDTYFHISTANLLIFMFGIIEQVALFSDDVKIVSNTLMAYIPNIYALTFSFFILFISFSTFASYYLFGDFALIYYRQIDFILLKIIGMMYRGTVDNFDYEAELNPLSMKKEFSSFTKYAHNSNNSLVEFSGFIAFFMFSLSFFLVINLVVKTAQAGYFLVVYRNKYEEYIKMQRDQKKLKQKI